MSRRRGRQRDAGRFIDITHRGYRARRGGGECRRYLHGVCGEMAVLLCAAAKWLRGDAGKKVPDHHKS